LRHWFRPPRHLLVLFLGTTLGFWAVLGWLGWKTLEQDRAIAEQEANARLQDTTDTVAAELARNLSQIEEQLDRFASLPRAELADSLSAYALLQTGDAIVVAIDDERLQAFPRGRLLFYPELPAADEPNLDALPARAYMQLNTDPAGAIEIFRALAQTGDERTRAEALLAIGRAQTALGRSEAALATYAQIGNPSVLVGGRPAELHARFARCALLAELGRRAELLDEARRLDDDLHAGRFQLTRAAFLHYEAEARALTGESTPPVIEPEHAVSLSLAEGVDALWTDWRDARTSGRASRTFGDESLFLLWRASGDRLVAVVAGHAFIEDTLLGPIRGMLDGQRVHVELEDGGGRPVVSYGTAESDAPTAVLSTADSQLPWTLVVASDPRTDAAQLSNQRRLVFGGLAFLAVFVAAGGYFSFRAMTREIEAARLKSDFVAAVSHEFRTPLTLLRQFSDLLAEDRVSSDDERHRYYAALQRGTRRLTRLVEDLLDLGRMESGSRAFTLEPVMAKDCVTALVDEFQDEVRSRGYTVAFAWQAPGDVVVNGDEAAIGRALWNLLDNAVKYSPNCRTVWVTGACEDRHLVIRVRDEGLGVSNSERRAIFQKFVRGSATGGYGIKGTGLGLALVEQIVEAHGGEVRLESTEGAGSTFAIVLPIATEASAPELAPGRAEWHAS
jgi:signal transduction histidine kinase